MLLTLKCSRDGKAFAVRLGRRRSSSSRSVEIGIRMMEAGMEAVVWSSTAD